MNRLVIAKYFPHILIIFHVVGIFLFWQSKTASDLTWLNLLLCGVLVYFSELERWKSLMTLAIIFIGGFLIEWVGTATGLLFGTYEYGTVLGWKFLGVSLIIGVNWYAIVVSASNLARLVNTNVYIQSLIAGVLCVAMDYVIEPVAVQYGFWQWEGGVIPVYNYITWFVFAVIFSLVYLKNSFMMNKTAVWLYFIWLTFFIVLSLF